MGESLGAVGEAEDFEFGCPASVSDFEVSGESFGAVSADRGCGSIDSASADFGFSVEGELFSEEGDSGSRTS